MTAPSLEWAIESRMDLLEGLCLDLREFLSIHGVTDLTGSEIVFYELVANAIRHGNGLNGKKLVHIAVTIDSDSVLITVQDEGKGFDHRAVFSQCSEGPQSHGLWIVHNFSKELVFNDKGNRVAARLSKMHPRESPCRASLPPADNSVTEAFIASPQLRHAQKLESLGVLAGCIAHDFNNMLNVILGYADLMRQELSEMFPRQNQFREYLDAIHQSGLRAAELVSQIRTFSREIEKERQHVKIQYLVHETLCLLQNTLPANISISTDIDKNCGSVLADASQIHQMIMNLCTNAYHAMREKGGRLDVVVQEVTLGVDRNKAQSDSSGGRRFVCVSVEDTGCGMDTETMQRIFDMYFTTKENNGGTGLGLPIVDNIVKSHGGWVNVQSQPGRGTTFKVYLPVSRDVETEHAQPQEQEKPFRLPVRARALVVDDVPFNARLGRRLLESMGFEAVDLTSSRDALDMFNADPNRFDLVLTDQVMPEFTGHELATRILRIRPDIPIILFTGFGNSIDEEKAASIGIRKFLHKPLEKPQLIKAVRELLAPESGFR